MSYMREVGFAIRQLTDACPKRERQIQNSLGLSDFEMQKLYAGRLFLTMADMRKISEVCSVSFAQLAKPDKNAYNNGIVHCMSEFTSNDNREKILDFIDAYIDAKELNAKAEKDGQKR